MHVYCPETLFAAAVVKLLRLTLPALPAPLQSKMSSCDAAGFPIGCPRILLSALTLLVGVPGRRLVLHMKSERTRERAMALGHFLFGSHTLRSCRYLVVYSYIEI